MSPPQAHSGIRSAAPPDAPRLAGAALRTTLASAFGQGLAIGLPIVVARQFGATASTDSFFLAFAGVSLIVTAAAGVGQTSAVPDLVDTMGTSRDDASAADHVLSFVVAVTLLGSVAVAGALVFWPSAPGAIGEAARQAVMLTPYAVGAGATSVAAGMLAADRSFARGAASLSLRWAGAVAAVLVLGGRLGIGAAALGLAAGEAVRFAVLRSLVIKRGIWYPRLVVPRASSSLHGLMRNSASQFLASLILAATLVVDRIAVASLGDGSVSLLEYAERLWQIPLGLGMTGVLAVALTEWSHDAIRTGSVARGRVARLASAAAAATVPLALAIGFWRHDITDALFGSTRLEMADRLAVGDLVGAFAMATPLYVAGVTYSRALLAERRAPLLLGVAILQLSIKLGANGVAVRHFGLNGIALTTAGMYAVALALFALVPPRPTARADQSP